MQLYELLKNNVSAISFIVLLLTTFIQISPIKIDPWTRLFSFLGKAINGNILSKIDRIEIDLNEHIVAGLRTDILRFANRHRRDNIHDHEEWRYIIKECDYYEEYLIAHSMKNGLVSENMQWLRDEYKRLWILGQDEYKNKEEKT